VVLGPKVEVPLVVVLAAAALAAARELPLEPPLAKRFKPAYPRSNTSQVISLNMPQSPRLRTEMQHEKDGHT
jgi:hypothetical protein